MLIKVHEAYRKVVAICDAELLGKKFTEGNMQLDVNPAFYGGKKYDEKKVIELYNAMIASTEETITIPQVSQLVLNEI